MAAWIIYLKERFPLSVHVLLVSGLALAGIYLGDGGFSPAPFGFSFIGVFIFFALLRLMDEVKDYDVDQLAHPERPLPIGLLQLDQVKKVIRWVTISMIAYALTMALIVNPLAGACYLLVTLYLWLMYCEFGISAWLTDRPVIYALSHQLILLFVCYFTVLVSQPNLLKELPPFYYSLMVMGAFFSYEVCRKLDPKAHPLLKTYLSLHGTTGVSTLVIAANLVALTGAWGLDLLNLMMPLEGFVIASLALLWFKPGTYKFVEGIAALSLIGHIWSIPISIWLF